MILICGGKNLLDKQTKHNKDTLYPTVIGFVQDNMPERVSIIQKLINDPFAVCLLDKDLNKIQSRSAITLTKIIILIGSGADKLCLITTLPDGNFPYTGYQQMDMSVAAGTGAEYVDKHFPCVPVEIIKKS